MTAADTERYRWIEREMESEERWERERERERCREDRTREK